MTSPVIAERMFRSGEKAMFLDSKSRRYLVTLNEEGEFHSHAGFVSHRDVINKPEGVVVESTKGAKFAPFSLTW